MNGVPLPPDHGFPARVMVPGIYGMKNVKWLTGLELVNHDYKGYWQQRNWPDDAFVKLSSRIDLPGDRETIRGTQYRVKGIAFGGLEKIQQVQISTDEGKTWKAATLEPPLSPYAWTHWYHDWAIRQPGEYTLAVRAIGSTGRAQATQFGVVTPKEDGRPPRGHSGGAEGMRKGNCHNGLAGFRPRRRGPFVSAKGPKTMPTVAA